MSLSGVTVNVRDGERRTHNRVLDFFLEGVQIFEDRGHGYGFVRCDDWVLIDFIKRELKGFTLGWRVVRHFVNPPEPRLVTLVSVLVGMGLVTSKGAMFRGYGGCLVLPQMLRIKRTNLHDVETTIHETVGVLARSFNTEQASIAVTTNHRSHGA